MTLTVVELRTAALPDCARCNGTFTIDAHLALTAETDHITYNFEPVEPYTKRYPLEPVDYAAYINSPDRAAFLAYVDGQVAGEVRVARWWNAYAYIDDLIVDVHYRRLGVGRALLERAVQWARERAFPGVMLETQHNNPAACRLYARCGFILSGFDRLLYRGLDPHTQEIALYWYLVF